MTDPSPIRIEFGPEVRADGIRRTLDTKVFIGGVQAKGITGITLRADPDNVWRATIECIPVLPDHIVAAPDEVTPGE